MNKVVMMKMMNASIQPAAILLRNPALVLALVSMKNSFIQRIV
jgi:hypothetical protein